MICILYLLVHGFYIVSPIDAIKIFVPNTNYGNLRNWREHQIPCDKTQIIFPTKSPKVFLNGTSSVYHLSDMTLPMNGEFIIDDRSSITVSDVSRETECEIVVAHFDKVDPDWWYNPMNWCQTSSLTSPCAMKPQIEAAMVPCSRDTVVFKRGNTFHVGVKQREPKIVANDIFLRGVLYRNTFLFRQKIRRTPKSNVVEFEKIGANYSPIIELQGGRCKDTMCYVNSNIKRMEYICPYVSCRPVLCQGSIKPTGSCCQLCGKMFSVKTKAFNSMKRFEKWFEDLMDDYYKTMLTFNILYVDKFKLEIVISSLDLDAEVSDTLATTIVEKIFAEKMLIGVESVQDLSWIMEVQKKRAHHSVLIIIIIIASVLLVLIIIFLLRRNVTRIPIISAKININLLKIPSIKFPTLNFHFFGDKFPSTRLKEDVDVGIIPGSVLPSMFGALEVIELPEKVTEVSFDNPIYDSEMKFEDSLQ